MRTISCIAIGETLLHLRNSLTVSFSLSTIRLWGLKASPGSMLFQVHRTTQHIFNPASSKLYPEIVVKHLLSERKSIKKRRN